MEGKIFLTIVLHLDVSDSPGNLYSLIICLMVLVGKKYIHFLEDYFKMKIICNTLQEIIFCCDYIYVY